MNMMEWIEDGLCRGYPSDYWFPDDDDDTTPRLAKAICTLCPVREQCLDHAMAVEPFGIWGGTDQTERELMRHANGDKLLLSAKFRKADPILRDLK